jgi:hypothetical protein
MPDPTSFYMNARTPRQTKASLALTLGFMSPLLVLSHLTEASPVAMERQPNGHQVHAIVKTPEVFQLPLLPQPIVLKYACRSSGI